MRKIAILLIGLMMIGVGFLSGCTENSENLPENNGIFVDSDSMSHVEFSQTGIIDKGDIVYYSKISNKSEIITWTLGRSIKYTKYGYYGDVILFNSMNDSSNQIVDRAMCWIEVEIEGLNTYYTIEKYGIIRQNASEPLYIPFCGIWNSISNSSVILDGNTNKRYHYQKFTHSGFITKADNKPTCDQLSGVCIEPVKFECIVGKITELQDR